MRTQRVTLGTQHVTLIFLYLYYESFSHDKSTVKNMPSGHVKVKKARECIVSSGHVGIVSDLHHSLIINLFQE